MFKSIKDEIIKLNAGINDVTNCQKAKKLRATLLKIGIPLAVVGALGMLICFVLFATAGMGEIAFDSVLGARVIVPMVLMIPCGAVAGIGIFLVVLALQIVVTSFVSKLVDETVGNNCPQCNAPLDDDAEYCQRCGTQCVNKCPSCNTLNLPDSAFCKKCGTKLNILYNDCTTNTRVG